MPTAAPLGDLHEGICCASPDSITPDPQFQLDFCNYGYARHTCPRFPSLDTPDAVRFAIASDSGDRIRIHYARERNHLPHSHGTLDFELHPAGWTAQVDGLLDDQANAYLRSYLRRRPRLEAEPRAQQAANLIKR